MKKQNNLKKRNSRVINRSKIIKNEIPAYITLVLVSLLPIIVSHLQTGQISMAINVAQGLASCVLIIKMVMDRK